MFRRSIEKGAGMLSRGKRYLLSAVATISLIVGARADDEIQVYNGEIADVSKTTRNGIDVYEVQFNEPGKNPKVVVAADGKLLTSDLVNPPGAIERMLTPTGATGTKLGSSQF